MRFTRAAPANTSGGITWGKGTSTRANAICEENHAVTAPSP